MYWSLFLNTQHSQHLHFSLNLFWHFQFLLLRGSIAFQSKKAYLHSSIWQDTCWFGHHIKRTWNSFKPLSPSTYCPFFKCKPTKNKVQNVHTNWWPGTEVLQLKNRFHLNQYQGIMIFIASENNHFLWRKTIVTCIADMYISDQKHDMQLKMVKTFNVSATEQVSLYSLIV